MAVAAAAECLKGLNRQDVDALYLASTTLPYKEKSNATVVATAADLRSDIITADFAGSLRAGTTALRAAVDAVKAGSAKQVLVVASDLRIGQPRSDFEPTIGDGAAAFLVSAEDVAVSIEDSYFISHEIYDVWRADGDTFPRTWEDRFVLEEGYLKVLPEAALGLMKKHNLTAKDFSKAVFYAPDARRHRDMARRLGFDPKVQVQDPLFTALGNTGTAFAPMMLIAALEEAKPGDRILLANYGNGADAFLLKVTAGINGIKKQRGIKKYLQSKVILKDYQSYAIWRGLIDAAPLVRRPPPRNPSPSAMLRETAQNIRFYGTRCKQCGYPQYPPQRVCTMCHAKDDFEDYSFSDKRAKLFTYTMDSLGFTLDPPLIVSVINFDGGGRAMLMMTDRDTEKLEIGMPLEMTFRKIYSSEGINNYWWKCMPVRE
jgi:3-hydroxy-3-methylglutaryl CoA synthase